MGAAIKKGGPFMIISHIGNRAVSLYITEAELKERNLAIETINQDQVQCLLAVALRESRLDGWEAAELEVFPGRDAVLLFARRKSGVPRHLLFSDFETLLHAVRLCPDVLPSALSRTKGGYLLTAYPFEGENLPAVLYEFGRELGQSAYLTAHLKEQGETLLPVCAMASLRAYFVH